ASMPDDRGVRARQAAVADIDEVLRVAAYMCEAIGRPVDDEWRVAAAAHLRARLGDDAAVFVVDSPEEPGRLVSVGAGSIQSRLPIPGRPRGQAGYIQWVSTVPDFRRRGASRAVMEGLLAWYCERGIEVVELHATPNG